MTATKQPVEEHQVGLPRRSFRVENVIWDAAMQKAKQDDLTLSQVIRRGLTEYVNS